ncbi:hypothetical protein P2318_08955 [Myxococcaceae bacterium GXIMD 01537]
MRTTQDWSRLGGIFIATLAAATALAVLGPRFLGLAAGPELEIITALKRTERDGLSLTLPGSREPLTSREHHFARITVDVEPGGRRATASATLDFTGALGGTEVSSLGVERVPFVLRDGDWEPETQAAPRLAAVVAALEARRRALEGGELEALLALGAQDAARPEGPELEQLLRLRPRRYRAEAWYLRLERDGASATERWQLQGSLPERPVDARGERSLSLVRESDQFLFSPALM